MGVLQVVKYFFYEKGMVADMEIRHITQENKKDYKDVMNPDEMEQIDRLSYHGIALHSETEALIRGILIWNDWTYLETENGEKRLNVEILKFQAEQPEDGMLLLEAYMQEAAERGVFHTQYRMPLDWEDERIPILRKFGFHLEEQESNQMVIAVGDLEKLPVVKQEMPMTDVVSIGEVHMQQIRKAIMSCSHSVMAETPRDLMSLPLAWFEPDISSCIRTDGRVRGLLLMHRTGSGVLETQLLCGFDETTNLNILQMIIYVMKSILKKYPPDTMIRIRWNRKQTQSLAKKMLNRSMGDMVIVAER